MEELLKQELLSLLNAAKTHIEEGETAEAIEKIEAAIANLENEGVATADEGGSEGEGGEGTKGEDGKEDEDFGMRGGGRDGYGRRDGMGMRDGYGMRRSRRTGRYIR